MSVTNPQQFFEKAKQAETAGDFREAARNYRLAALSCIGAVSRKKFERDEERCRQLARQANEKGGDDGR